MPAASTGDLDETITIGEVLQGLQPDFPDVKASKLRFLEDKGLVTPLRTAAGYRRYSTEDVDRVRYVLTAQRDHHLPLKVIAEHLDKLDRGLAPIIPDVTPRVTAAVAPAADDPPRDQDLAPRRVRVTAAELLESVGGDASLLDALAEHKLVQHGPGGYFDADDVLVAQLAMELQELGLSPRHLRPLRMAAERVAGLIENVARPELARENGPDQALDSARQVSLHALAMHAALVRSGVKRMFG